MTETNSEAEKSLYDELLSGERFERPRHRLRVILALGIVVLCVLRFFHLDADFPIEQRGTFARDSVLYTDEGWYAHNARELIRYGHWHRQADMNFLVNLPVQQIGHMITMSIFGPTIQAVRLTSVFSFIGMLVLTGLIVRRYEREWIVALSVMALMASNFFFFAYSRFGIAENTMLMFMLASVYTLTFLRERDALWIPCLAGFLFALAFFTKTSSITIAPVLGLLIFWPYRRNLIRFVMAGGGFSAVFIAVWLTHRYTLAIPFRADYDFFRTINVGMNMDVDPSAFGAALLRWIRWMRQIDRLVFYVFIYGIIPLFFLIPGLRRNPLVIGSYIYLVGYIFVFVVYNNLQPRYWAALSAPLAIIVVLTGKEIISLGRRYLWAKLLGGAYAIFLIVAVWIGVGEIIQSLQSPPKTFRKMSRDIRTIMTRELPGEHVLLGHISDQIALFADVRPVNDLYGPVHLEERILLHRPRFLVVQGQVDDKLDFTREMMRGNPADYLVRYETLNRFFTIHELARFDTLANYKDYQVILYRLDPITPFDEWPTAIQ